MSQASYSIRLTGFLPFFGFLSFLRFGGGDETLQQLLHRDNLHRARFFRLRFLFRFGE
ncbi:MAG: hypothetical protein HFE43_08770 [Oscillospiraceae bacterium]|nr:hypothetical protein [Oscillospiraceae bacterium]